MRRPLLVLAAFALASCEAADSTSATSTPPSSSPTVPEEQWTDQSIVLPAVPVSDVALHLIAHRLEDAPPDALIVEQPVVLAVGEEYAVDLRFVVESVWDTANGPLSGHAIFETSTLADPGQDTLLATTDGSETVRIEVLGEGTAQLQLTGTYVFDEAAPPGYDTAQPRMELSLSIVVVRPVGAQLALPFECRGQPRVLLEHEANTTGLSVRLTDADGEPIYAANVAPEAPTTLTVSPASGVQLAHSGEDGLAGLWTRGTAGPVAVTSALGPVGTLEAVESSAIDAMEIHFPLLGMGGGGLLLESGQSYGDKEPWGWARTSNIIGPTVQGLYVGEVRLCSQHRDADFVLTGSTPQRCIVDSHPGNADYPSGAPLQGSARVVADGECALQVHNARFDGGAGLTATLEVGLYKVDGMIETSPLR